MICVIRFIGCTHVRMKLGCKEHNKAKQRDKARGVQITIPLRFIVWQFEPHVLCTCWRRYVFEEEI